MVAFRKKKTIGNHIVRSDITPHQITLSNPTLPCGKCKKTCHLINQSTKLTNSKNERSVDITSGGCCKTKNIIYAARCKIHDLIYIGHTWEELSQRFSKHRYDAKKRPDNNELAKHIAKYYHDFDKDVDVTILKLNVKTAPEREIVEDKFICTLGTRSPNSLNVDLSAYGKEMYETYDRLLKKP